MITISLKDFILNAKFGSIKMGWNRQKVIEILGGPVSQSDFGYGSYGISYSGYQLFFFDDELHYIQNDHVKADCLNHDEWIYFENEKIKFDLWFLKPNQDISLNEVIKYLELENAKFKLINQKVAGKDYRVGEVKMIQMACGVKMHFDHSATIFQYSDDGELLESTDITIDNEADFVLNSISYKLF